MANANHICYCCLAEIENPDDMKDMLEDEFDRSELKLASTYTTCSGIDLSSNTDDGTLSPILICKACEIRLRASFEFRELCQNSHETMKRRWESAFVDVKEECESDHEISDLQTGTNVENMTFEITELTEPLGLSATDSVITQLHNNTPPGSSDKNVVVTQLKCLPCNKEFNHQATLRQHIQRTHIDVASNDHLYRCPYCGLGFKLFATANVHFHALHSDMNVKNVYPCYKCKRVYLVKNFFLKHECCKSTTSHSSLSATPKLTCNVCSGQFNNADELLCHQMTTCLDQSLRHFCSVCNQAYDTQRKLARHMSTHVVQPDPNCTFDCDVCGAKKPSARTLKLHKRSHNIQRPFPCTLCKVACKTEAQLQHHQDVQHLMKRKYECDVCGKKFRSRHAIQSHLSMHSRKTGASNLRKFACHICERSFVRPRDRERHLLIHSNTLPMKCDQCDRAFRDTGALNEHRRRIHEGVYFLCHICEKTYSQRLKLRDHLFVHRGFNPFLCTGCPQQFIKKYLFRVHLLTHNIEYDDQVHGYRETEDFTEILAASVRKPSSYNPGGQLLKPKAQQ